MQPIKILLITAIHKSEARNSKSGTRSNARNPNPKEARLLEKSWGTRESRHSGQAKRDPESSSAEGGIQAILDSGFRRNDGVNDLCRNLRRLGIGNLNLGFVSGFDIRISDLFFCWGGFHESHRSPSGSLHRMQNLRTVLRGGKGKRRENPLKSRSGVPDSKAPCPGGGE
jgi:hypothetical protein